MIAEIPDPACVGAGSPFTTGVQNARATFDARYTATTSFQTANVPVRLIGVGFFDFLHGQTGVAPNGIELHAVTSIVFNPGSGSPDFSLAASPTNVAITQGTSGSTTVTETPLNGFSGSVSLSASGLPTGVSAQFSPASTTSTSALTLTASSTATTGSATVTITGTSGSTTHTTTINLTVNPASSGGGALTAAYDSTLKAPKCATVGTSCDSGPTLLNGRASLSGGAEPNQPNTINNSCADGTSGTYHSDESNDRLMIASADGGPLTAGKSAKITATVWAYSTTADALDLYSAADATNPSWVFLSTIAPSATGAQTLSTSFTLPTGGVQAIRANFRYQGSASSCSTGAYDDHDDLIFAVGSGTATPDFGLSASPTSASVTQGSSVSDTITVSPQNGFTGSVALSASGLPTGVTASFNPSSTTGTSTLTLTASSTATTGPATVTITGTSGSLTHTTTVSLTVNATAQPNFSLSASPTSASVTQGSSVSDTITISPQNGFTGSVALSASGLPSGVTASFNPASATSSSTLTLTASSTATTGPATVTITGTSGSLTHTATLSLTVNASGGTATELVTNGGFEGSISPWTVSTGTDCSAGCTGESAHSGTGFVWLDGYGTATTDTATQTVTIPSTITTATLTFWLHVDTAETTTTTAYDKLTVQLLNSSGTVLTTLATYSNLNAGTGYTQKSFDVSAYKGQTVKISFKGVEDSQKQTSFVIDDVSLKVQ